MERIVTLSNGTQIGDGEKCFIIAEIGQNHQGNLDIAKRLIEAAKLSGADCVKFQKTCLSEKYNKSFLAKLYNSEHSWGKTYGEHKEHLEFTEEQFLELQAYAKQVGILFTASAMDSTSLKFLIRLNVPFVKIGSGDAKNIFLIKEAAASRKPLIISTGMCTWQNVIDIYDYVRSHHTNFALLQCTSAYPTPVEDVNLNVIRLYQKRFPEIVIGYSGHELGIDVSVAAVAIGAKIIERHITLNKTWKGRDHGCSLEPHEFKELVTKIRLVERALGKPQKSICPSEQTCLSRLGKTIVANKAVQAGHVLQKDDLAIKVAEPKGIDGALVDNIIGRKLKVDLEEDESLMDEHLLDK